MDESPDFKSAKAASTHISKGIITVDEFCLKVFDLFFYSSETEWPQLMECFTENQHQLIRTYSDKYFSKNDYMPHPSVPPGFTEKEIHAVAVSHRDRWVELHQWIIQATGG